MLLQRLCRYLTRASTSSSAITVRSVGLTRTPQCRRRLGFFGPEAFWRSADTDLVGPELRHDYFGLHRFDEGEGVNYQLPYGEWIRLLRAHGLVVEDLIEPRPPPNATSTYLMPEELDWARRWPSESIWKARKRG